MFGMDWMASASSVEEGTNPSQSRSVKIPKVSSDFDMYFELSQMD